MWEMLGESLLFPLSLVQMAVAVLLFAHKLQPREHFGARVAVVVAMVVALTAAMFSAAVMPGAQEAEFSFDNAYSLVIFALFAAIVVWCTWMAWFLYESSVWTALFCSTAGYTLQNFSSGMGELITECLGRSVGASAASIPLSLVCMVIVYTPFYLLVIRKISRQGLEGVNDRRLLVAMLVVIMGVIGFDIAIKSLTEQGIGLAYVVMLRVSHLLTCVLSYVLEYDLLVRREMEAEQRTLTRVMEERERQYQQSRESIDAINVKCHDIRHQIRQLGREGAVVDGAVLDDIAREVDVYDARVETGNEALDTILTEKRLLCEREGIELGCVADGHALDFMAAADVYSLIGNALDNAIEAVDKVAEPGRRCISVVVREAMGVASIHVENYFDGTVSFRDGLPTTTKADRTSHGFGSRSMRLTVERYGGTLSMTTRDDTFHLNAMIPVGETERGR